MTAIHDAEALARRLFEGKTDKLVEPYINHCLRVAGLLPADAPETEKVAAVRALCAALEMYDGAEG